MFHDIFCHHYGDGNRNIFSVSWKTCADLLNKIRNRGDWKICISCNLDQFYFCRAYDRYNFLFTGNHPYKIKPFYHCTASDISSCPTGMAVSFCQFKRSVVDIPRYRNCCQHDRNIAPIAFEKFLNSTQNIIRKPARLTYSTWSTIFPFDNFISRLYI